MPAERSPMASPRAPAAAPHRATAAEAFTRSYLEALASILRLMPVADIGRILEVLERVYDEGRRVFLVGNGGSAATASHMATDLSKTVAGRDGAGPGFKAIALTDNLAQLTAWGNDVGYAEVFAGPLKSQAAPGDVLILISGSGNSPNLLRAADAARSMGLQTIALLGQGGGRLRPLVDLAVVVPSDAYGPIEDAHLALNHLVTAYFIERRLRPAQAA